MDRRRASQGSPTMDEEDRARKRRRQSNEPTSTRAAVRTVFDTVWNHQERNRNIRMHFEQLPSNTTYPDYYTKIDKPISLNEVRAKLDKYASVDEIKKDLLLMVENATIYNKAKSQVHSDALRLRYVIESFSSEDASGRTKRDSEVLPTPSRSSARGSRSGSGALQDAQLRIIDELMTLKDDQGELISSYFRSLPSKKNYADYYQIIEHPISLNMIRTKAKEGSYKQWSDFEEAFYLIRENAEKYNDSASDVVKDARSLEEHFTARLYEEKVKLGDQSITQPKLKLSLGRNSQASVQSTPTPKIKLNVNNKQSVQQTLAPTVTPQPKLEVNGNTPGSQTQNLGSPPNTTQARQRSLSQPSSHGASASPKAPPAMPTLRSSSAASPPRGLAANGIGNVPAESITLQQRSHTPHSQTSVGPMPPPAQRLSATPRAPSYSPVPSAGMSPAPGSTSAPQIMNQNQHYRPPHHYEEPRYRPEGQDPATFFITNTRITSTSYLNSGDQYVKELRPDQRKFTSQFYLHLPTEYQTLIILPELSFTLTSRPYRLIFEVKFGSGPGKEIRPSMPNPKNKHEQHFEIRLAQGVVNTVECTVVTQASAKNGTVSIGGWEMERYRLFFMPGA